MANPIDELIESLSASGDLSGVSVTGMVAQPSPPGLVIRPYEPWMVPDTYCDVLQHYLAIPLVQASSAHDGVRTLYDMALTVIDLLPETWEFVSVGQPALDESTGVSFLVAPIRIDYKGAAQ